MCYGFVSVSTWFIIIIIDRTRQKLSSHHTVTLSAYQLDGQNVSNMLKLFRQRVVPSRIRRALGKDCAPQNLLLYFYASDALLWTADKRTTLLHNRNHTNCRIISVSSVQSVAAYDIIDIDVLESVIRLLSYSLLSLSYECLVAGKEWLSSWHRRSQRLTLKVWVLLQSPAYYL